MHLWYLLREMFYPYQISQNLDEEYFLYLEIIMSEDYSNKNVSILNVGNVLVDIEISISNNELSKYL